MGIGINWETYDSAIEARSPPIEHKGHTMAALAESVYIAFSFQVRTPDDSTFAERFLAGISDYGARTAQSSEGASRKDRSVLRPLRARFLAVHCRNRVLASWSAGRVSRRPHGFALMVRRVTRRSFSTSPLGTGWLGRQPRQRRVCCSSPR